MKKTKPLLLFSLFVLFPLVAQGVERVEGTGKYCSKNIDVAYETAIHDAKRNAIEKAGIVVTSGTVLSNSQIVKDIVSSVASALIKNIQITPPKDSACKTGSGNICCSVKIKADLEKNQQEEVDFRLSLVLNKSEYTSGEEVSATLFSRISCYPYLFYIDEQNNIYRVYPNKIEKDLILQGTLQYPVQKMIDEGYIFQVYAEKETSEELLFVCTQEKNELLGRLFPELTVGNLSELKDILQSSYKFQVEKLSKILTKIRYGTYAIDNALYRIVP